MKQVQRLAAQFASRRSQGQLSRIALFEVVERNLVADGHVMLGGQAECGMVLRDAAQHVRAGRQALDQDDADIVSLLVHKQVRHLVRGWVRQECLLFSPV